MKTAVIVWLALCPMSLAAQTAEGNWTCTLEIADDPAMPDAETRTFRFALGILPEGRAVGQGTLEDQTGQHPLGITATWALDGQTITVEGTMTAPEPAPFTFTSEFVSYYDMAYSRTFGSGVRYASACAKDD